MRAPRNPTEPPKAAVPDKPQIERSSAGLRNALFEQLDLLRSGKITPLQANSFARLSEQVIRTVEIEMEVEKVAASLHKRGDNLFDILPPTLPLGDREDAKNIDISPRWHDPEET